MADPEHVAILKRGVNFWNRWRQDNPLLKPDLSIHRGFTSIPLKNLRGADFHDTDLDSQGFEGADLRDINFRGAHLVGSTFDGADLTGVDLSGLNLSISSLTGTVPTFNGANLKNANLRLVNLGHSIMVRADLSGANLLYANLSFVDLNSANFREATLGYTTFADTNLKGAKGLASCRHDWPSSLDHKTFIQSGNLPLSFLRGCGLTDQFIDYLPSLLDNPIQFYSCFISYSTKDQGFADQLYADLQNSGVSCWFAPHNIKGGKKLHEQIDAAIRLHDRLLLVLSDQSMNSEWVKTEIAQARKREIYERRQVLFPISLVPFKKIREWKCFDADTGKDSAREVREYFILDFSKWKNHDSYQQAFQQLIRDLKLEGKTDQTG